MPENAGHTMGSFVRGLKNGSKKWGKLSTRLKSGGGVFKWLLRYNYFCS